MLIKGLINIIPFLGLKMCCQKANVTITIVTKIFNIVNTNWTSIWFFKYNFNHLECFPRQI